MTSTIDEILARLGEDHAKPCTMNEIVEVLRKVGCPISKGTLYKWQCTGDGPPRVIWMNRCVYRLGDVLEWALARVKTPDNLPQKRSAQTRRANAEGREANRVAAAA
jgi:hypothetical protein